MKIWLTNVFVGSDGLKAPVLAIIKIDDALKSKILERIALMKEMAAKDGEIYELLWWDAGNRPLFYEGLTSRDLQRLQANEDATQEDVDAYLSGEECKLTINEKFKLPEKKRVRTGCCTMNVNAHGEVKWGAQETHSGISLATPYFHEEDFKEL